MKVLIAGDFCQRYRVNEMISQGKYYMLDSVKEIIEKCDLRIVNYEFPIITNANSPIDKIGPVLGGSLESINVVKFAGFNVCTLANNHILDQGERCCLETMRHLNAAGLKTVGVGKNIQEASEILYIHKQGKTIAIINCCEHEFSIAASDRAGANPLNIIQQYYQIKQAKSNADYVLIIVHAGIEHYQFPTPRMKENYRFLIDAGADAVVNHHQHCYSGYEIYNGRPIFYGIGNFLFDSPNSRNTIWNQGYMVELDFLDSGVMYKIHPYNQCGELPIVELMAGEDIESFNNRLNKINEIIQSDYKLQVEFDSYSYRNRKFILSAFTPWVNRIFVSAFVRGLLPSFLPKSKIKYIKSRIMCESHYDLTINELSRNKK